MVVEQKSARKSKAHVRYRNSADKIVPGVTTITGVMNKPLLVPWANKLGLQGIEVGKYVDDLAEIGTLAHYFVECHIKSQIEGTEVKPEIDDYSKNQIDAAENSFIKFLDWESKHEVKYIASELQLVSEKHQYGGTIDIYCEIDGKKTLADLKTCKAIYSEHHTQVAGGYGLLLVEHGYKVEDIIIIRIGRDDVEGFEAKPCPQPDLHKKRFLLCRDLYEINKILNRR